MAMVTLEGVYADGKIELDERPKGVTRARVHVTFLPDPTVADDEARKLAERREAGLRLLATMRAGIDFGGEKFNREEIYDDRMNELDSRRARH